MLLLSQDGKDAHLSHCVDVTEYRLRKITVTRVHNFGHESCCYFKD